jgi:hypothetical protein
MNLGLGAKIGIAAAVIALVSVVAVGLSFVGVNNNCVQMENGVTAQYEQNKNNYDNMWKKFKEASQVNESYASDVKKAFTDAIQSRYGGSGAKAAILVLKEHNPNLDPSTYNKLEQLIDSGRSQFAAEQTMLIDKKRTYQNYTGTFPNSVISRTLGFPRIELAKYGIVTSDATDNAFQTKKADEVKLRQ